MPTIGQKLKEAGLVVTTWLDQQTGEEKHGKFDPAAREAVERYGNPAGLAVKDWPARNKVGAHAAGDLSQVTVEIARDVLDADQTDSRWDLSDIDFVEGAGAHILKLAIAAKKIVPQQPGTGAVPGPGPVVPAPFEAMTDRQLAEITALNVNKILGVVSGSPAHEDDGKALAALKSIRNTVGVFTRTLGDRPAEALRGVLKEILGFVAEGGA